MRIISGEWGGRVLLSPGPRTRPTQDRVRQILFDILGATVQDGPALDLYAGSGAIGLEALSRGAPRTVFVESDRRTTEVLRENCRALGAEDRTRVLPMAVRRALVLLQGEGASFRWILADPPYGDAGVKQLLEFVGSEGAVLLEPNGGLVLETRGSDLVRERVGLLQRYRVREAGGTALHFFARAGVPEAEVGLGKEDGER